MTFHSILSRMIAVLVFAALASAPFGDAMAASRAIAQPRAAVEMTDMAMAVTEVPGMDMSGEAEAIACCPDAAPEPAMDCDKSACPSMASCTQQCIPASVIAGTDGIRNVERGNLGLHRPQNLLVSLIGEPPARPPRT